MALKPNRNYRNTYLRFSRFTEIRESIYDVRSTDMPGAA